MRRSTITARIRRVALIMLALSISVAVGACAARWAVADANGFYMTPTDRHGTIGNSRPQPVADSFWNRQRGEDPGR